MGVVGKHNATCLAVMQCLAGGPATWRELCDTVGVHRFVMKPCITRLQRYRWIEQVGAKRGSPYRALVETPTMAQIEVMTGRKKRAPANGPKRLPVAAKHTNVRTLTKGEADLVAPILRAATQSITWGDTRTWEMERADVLAFLRRVQGCPVQVIDTISQGRHESGRNVTHITRKSTNGVAAR